MVDKGKKCKQNMIGFAMRLGIWIGKFKMDGFAGKFAELAGKWKDMFFEHMPKSTGALVIEVVICTLEHQMWHACCCEGFVNACGCPVSTGVHGNGNILPEDDWGVIMEVEFQSQFMDQVTSKDKVGRGRRVSVGF